MPDPHTRVNHDASGLFTLAGVALVVGFVLYPMVCIVLALIIITIPLAFVMFAFWPFVAIGSVVIAAPCFVGGVCLAFAGRDKRPRPPCAPRAPLGQQLAAVPRDLVSAYFGWMRR